MLHTRMVMHLWKYKRRFVSDVVDSGVTVSNFVPSDPGSVCNPDAIQNVAIEHVQCSDIMEEAHI